MEIVQMNRKEELNWFLNQYLNNPNERSYRQLLTMLEADLLRTQLANISKPKEVVKDEK